MTLLFSNHRQTPVRIVWLDESGKRHERAVVKGASRWLVDSFVHHTWIVLDESGASLGHITAPDKSARIVIH